MSDAVETPSRAVALALEELLRSVPGVVAVYPSASLPAAVVGRVLAATTSLEAPSLVSVSLVVAAIDPGVTGDTTVSAVTTVTAVIGVSDDSSARETAQAAHEAVRWHLASIGALPAHITVRVGMVG